MLRRTVVAGVLAAGVMLIATCTTAPAPPVAPAPQRGAALYARHCAICHGATGEADTPVAELLRPRPVPFRAGAFALVSTRNGVPTDDDLVASLRRGSPGSTMMAWDWLPEADLRALASEVRGLAVAARASEIERVNAIGGTVLPSQRALALAVGELTPGAAVGAAPELAATEPNLAAGRELFARHCASCHGADARGLAVVGAWPDGAAFWPRDLTAGYLRGGASHRALSQRILAGMPGVGMPPAAVTPAEASLLVGYVQSVIGAGAADRHVQLRRALPAPRVARLPADGEPFATGTTARLPLAPLWWRAEAPAEVTLHVAHDGERLLLELEWADRTRDDRAQPDGSYGDGVAVQWTSDPDAPLVGMGSAAKPVNVWRWRAYDPKEAAGMLDVAEWMLHAGLDVPSASWRPRARAESVALQGIGSAASATTGGTPLPARAWWNEGRWRVRLQRALHTRPDHEVELRTGRSVSFALAVWDGSIDHHAGSKAITTWHVLELQR
jgi:mono/diheme cytochrome c family protein